MSYHPYHHDDHCTFYSTLEQVAELNNVRLIQPQEAWRSWNDKPQFPAELSSHYGEWHEIKMHTPIDPSKVFVMPDYCGGCDYGNSNLVEVSNHKAILDMLPSEYEDGVEYIDYNGDFGTFAVAIRLDAITPDILEALEGLDDYSLIDESLHSELEMNAQNEAWESDTKSEFRQALGEALASQFESSSGANQRTDETDELWQARIEDATEWLTDECGDIADDNLSELFYLMTDLSNTYWENEQGSEVSIDVERVVNGSLGRKQDSDYSRKAYANIASLVQTSLGDRKYEFGIVRYVNPDQLSLNLSEVN